LEGQLQFEKALNDVSLAFRTRF